MFDSVLRFFTDELSGSECAIILRNGEEICVTADEAWDIDCLLYTSPSPRDGLLSRMPSSA